MCSPVYTLPLLKLKIEFLAKLPVRHDLAFSKSVSPKTVTQKPFLLALSQILMLQTRLLTQIEFS